ncbi:hypothetical protein AltMyV_sM2gp1 [Alternaria alternata virus 1]|uniref:Uncharacterized protein n=1 Tax=Alternaria alternata virus 1 TaxID=483537 RepID=B3IXK3_9VIRU|nr:hypothetical protein AltMyV_sM2gp1 [Alternaria alternata virus 1]BAG49050.1 hypothetical protein [Alternaria alternata virus 1]
MATFGSAEAYRAAQLAAIDLLTRGDWGDFGGLGETSDVFDEHERFPEDPFDAPDHIDPGSSWASVATGSADDISREVTPTVVDYVPRREPYSVRGVDIVEPVTAFCSPADLGMANFPGNVSKGSATTLRRAGSAAANAGAILGTDMLMAPKASVQAIMARVVSALEMLQSGWDVGGPPDVGLDVRHAARDDFDDASARYPQHAWLYIPSDWTEQEVAALVSLMVEGGPAAYRWGYARGDPGGDEGNGQARERVMPAGAAWRWPGGWSNYLLIGERDRGWNVAFGGDALSVASLSAVLRRMVEAYGQRIYLDACRAAAVANRAYCPPCYQAGSKERDIGTAFTSDRVVVRDGNGGHMRQIVPARNMVKDEPGVLPRPAEGWDPVDDGGVVQGGCGGSVWALPVFPSQRDADRVGRFYAPSIDDRGPGGAGRAPPHFRSVDWSPVGLTVVTNHGRRLFPWAWDPPPMAEDRVNEEGVEEADEVADAWVRMAACYLRKVEIVRALEGDHGVHTREGDTRTVFGTSAHYTSYQMPRLNLDGWWPALIGLSVLRHDRVVPKLDRRLLRPAFTKFAADVHLLTHRTLFESGNSVADLSDALVGAKVVSRFPPAYRAGVWPHVFSSVNMPYGNYECLESGVLLGGGNETEGVGFNVPGSWKWDGVQRKAELDGSDAPAIRQSLRALDSVARKLYFYGGTLRLDVHPDRPVYVVRPAGSRLYHPYFVPVRVLEDRLPSGVRYTAIGSAAHLLSPGRPTDVGRASGVI